MARGESKAHSGSTRNTRSKNDPSTKKGRPEDAGTQARGKGGNNTTGREAEHWENFDHTKSPRGHE